MGRGADKLLQRMRDSASGWRPQEVDRLLTGFGFRCKQGKKHSIYEHEEHSDLSMSVPRHRSLRDWVVEDAVDLIDRLERRKGANEDEEERS